MPDVAFVMAPARHPLRGLVAAIREELARQGMHSSLHESFPEPDPGRLYVLVAAPQFVRDRGAAALPSAALLKRTLFLGADAPESVAAARDLYDRAGRVFDISQTTVEALHRAGIPGRLLRPGYCAQWDHFDVDAARDIDIAFLGAHSPRRTRYLGRATDVLARRRCVLRIVEPGELDAAERYELLSRTKVLINLHRGEQDQLEWLRALEAIHAGAAVVSEHATGFAPFEAGRHLLFASPDSLPWVADSLLRDEARLARIQTDAYERLRDWLPLSTSVAVMRAALLEMLGRPLRSDDGDPRPGPVLGTDSENEHEHEHEHEREVVRTELRGTRQELVDVRRQLSRLEDTMRVAVGEERPPGAPPEPFHNTAWDENPSPRVSVLLTLAGGAERVRRTLESVLTSRLRELEVIVVGDGDHEGAVAARDWLAAHSAIASVYAEVARPGRGAARNLALELARAPACLVIDAGEAMYPRCAMVLADALDAEPEADFVYPIEAVAGESDAFLHAGGDHLVGFREWDPAWLRGGNDVGSPVLVRTAPLRALGGFATSVLLNGYESYDLWCRMAEHGHRALRVAEILCRRPVEEAAEALGTRRPAPGAATTALLERSPTVLADAFAVG